MDTRKATLLFGELPPGADPDDPDLRAELLAEVWPELRPLPLAVLEAVANQIVDEDPPAVWATAQRLLDESVDAEDVLQQLALTFTPYVVEALSGEDSFDVATYDAALSRLPLPPVAASREALVQAARTRRVATMDELMADAAAQLGARAEDSGVEGLLDQLLEDLMDRDGPLLMLADEQVVHVEAVTDDVVLTHRVSAADVASGLLLDVVDLAGFCRRDPAPLPDPAPPVGTVVAVRVRDGGALSVDPLEELPPIDLGLVALLRSCYNQAVAEPWLPVPVEELVLASVVAEPASFSRPWAPLTDLLDAAGLEVRGHEVAHEESVWRSGDLADELHRLMDRFGAGEPLDTILRVLTAVVGELDVAAGRDVLGALEDPTVLEAVSDYLLGDGDDPARLEQTAGLAARLLSIASRPTQKATARWLQAVVAERDGRLDDAEELLREGVRLDPEGEPWADRLAWFRFDRGDAETASALWRGLGDTAEDSDDLRQLEALPAAPTVTLGRNERCWCGSGRKYKQCHLGRSELPPLPDRVGWLCRKATGFLERRGGAAPDEVTLHVVTRAVDPDDRDSLLEALTDPLVLDVVLHEGGCFDRFLHERGALLPEDEALLAQAWTLVDRSVHEVLEVRPGAGVSVRDLRTGDVVDVRERTFSTVTRTGELVCARAVPDGVSHQFVGGVFAVARGTEGRLLDLLDERDGLALLAHVADLHRPTGDRAARSAP